MKYFKNFSMLLNNGQHRLKYTQYNKQIGRYTVLVVFNRFYYNARQKSIIGIFQ